MKSLLIFWTLFLPTMCIASEEWLCTSEASQVHNGNVFSCGVGTGKDEDEARSKAFVNAQSEFDRICGASTNCRGRAVTVEPRRTTCEPLGDSHYKCYRLIVFSVGSDLGTAKVTNKAGRKTKYTLGNFWNDWQNTYLQPKGG